ncbi:amino acid deaminase [Massilia endophytica]|uniref:amino acid deaminase n=1 Tax=Massilia endophytica TaxID=2899220 RepID=UPI001E289855|nr:amino acid deaminase [Massilia endophytica]UGQ46254.1 amino acid deaminase [Massilia endophytica]
MSQLPSLPALDGQTLLPGVKGLPLTAPLRQADIARQGWNVLRGDTSYPVALLKESALAHNLNWMQRFCAHFNVLLAPHGKTTMSPQLFAAQIANGGWGITLATIPQVQIAARFGIRRVLLANELAGPSDIRAVLQLMKDQPDFEFFALADSLEGVARLSQAVQASGLQRPLPLLVEQGAIGKRAGCRTPEEVLEVARAIAAAPGLHLAGIEGYEGVLTSDDRAASVVRVNEFLAQMRELLNTMDSEGLFGGPQIIISAGGSSHFDLVARGFAGIQGLSRPVLPVLRSGCYLTNDHGHYYQATKELSEREPEAPAGGLQPALEVWSVVLSRPEPGLAILSMGKRDASHDLGLPHPLFVQRSGAAAPEALPAEAAIVKMNDQHGYLRLPDGYSIEVGDLVGCGISHPCTTFDKWPLMLVVDDSYQVLGAVNTFF